MSVKYLSILCVYLLVLLYCDKMAETINLKKERLL